MNEAKALKSLKNRLDIDADDTTFDGMLKEYLGDGVTRLSPTVYNEVDPIEKQVSTDEKGRTVVDLTEDALDDVRFVEANDSGGMEELTNTRVHANKLYIRGLSSDVSTVTVYGLCEYDMRDLPRYLHVAVYWFAMSEFYNFLVGNKSRYNAYMQNGRGDVDEMQDLADFYETKAEKYLSEKVTPYGR